MIPTIPATIQIKAIMRNMRKTHGEQSMEVTNASTHNVTIKRMIPIPMNIIPNIISFRLYMRSTQIVSFICIASFFSCSVTIDCGESS